MLDQPRSLTEAQQYAIGEWESLTVELRPTEDRTGSGVINPTYLRRRFIYQEGNKFTGTITMYGDNYGSAALMKFEFKGDLNWGSPHPIITGAWNIDYVLSDGFAVTPLHPQSAEMLNQGRPENIAPFEAGKATNILQKSFPLFNLAEGEIATDYDLIYFSHGLLFMGAKHVDGTPFDKPERRPHQLQIPLQRISA